MPCYHMMICTSFLCLKKFLFLFFSSSWSIRKRLQCFERDQEEIIHFFLHMMIYRNFLVYRKFKLFHGVGLQKLFFFIWWFLFLLLLCFSSSELCFQKLLSYVLKNCSQIQSLTEFRVLVQRIIVREQRKKAHNQLYRFLPQTGRSPVPLALPRRVH